MKQPVIDIDEMNGKESYIGKIHFFCQPAIKQVIGFQNVQ
jgi:hypothetical protein